MIAEKVADVLSTLTAKEYPARKSVSRITPPIIVRDMEDEKLYPGSTWLRDEMWLTLEALNMAVGVELVRAAEAGYLVTFERPEIENTTRLFVYPMGGIPVIVELEVSNEDAVPGGILVVCLTVSMRFTKGDDSNSGS